MPHWDRTHLQCKDHKQEDSEAGSKSTNILERKGKTRSNLFDFETAGAPIQSIWHLAVTSLTGYSNQEKLVVHSLEFGQSRFIWYCLWKWTLHWNFGSIRLSRFWTGVTISVNVSEKLLPRAVNIWRLRKLLPEPSSRTFGPLDGETPTRTLKNVFQGRSFISRACLFSVFTCCLGLNVHLLWSSCAFDLCLLDELFVSPVCVFRSYVLTVASGCCWHLPHSFLEYFHCVWITSYCTRLNVVI